MEGKGSPVCLRGWAVNALCVCITSAFLAALHMASVLQLCSKWMNRKTLATIFGEQTVNNGDTENVTHPPSYMLLHFREENRLRGTCPRSHS